MSWVLQVKWGSRWHNEQTFSNRAEAFALRDSYRAAFAENDKQSVRVKRARPVWRIYAKTVTGAYEGYGTLHYRGPRPIATDCGSDEIGLLFRSMSKRYGACSGSVFYGTYRIGWGFASNLWVTLYVQVNGKFYWYDLDKREPVTEFEAPWSTRYRLTLDS